MTYKQAIEADIEPYSVSDALIERACAEYGLTPSAEFTSRTSEGKAVLYILRQMVQTAESNAGYSLTYNLPALRLRITTLARELGLDDLAREYNPSPSVEIIHLW